MGKQLAQMHRSLSPNGLYGFDQDNYIGLSPQSNQWTESWCNFYLNHRLLPQIRLFESNGHCIQEKELFLQKARERLSSHNPSPSLLHGFALLFCTMSRDLWGGNVGFIRPSTPVLFDPATYYGDRETDILMTQVTTSLLLTRSLSATFPTRSTKDTMTNGPSLMTTCSEGTSMISTTY